MEKGKDRIQWIDIAKAITILLVVFGHTARDEMSPKLVYAFHVATFFFLAGMTCKEGNTLRQIKNDITRIMVPYYLFGVVSIFVFAVLGNFASGKLDIAADTSIGRNLWELIVACPKGNKIKFNMPLWFLPCLFVTKLMYYGLRSLCKGKPGAVLLLSSLFAVGGFAYTRLVGVSLPFNLNVAVKMLVFFSAGRSFFLWMPKMEKFCSAKGKTLALGCGLLLVTLAIAWFSPKVNYSGDTFPNIPSFLATGPLGTLGVCFVSMSIGKCKAMEYIGKRTLAILAMHKFPVLLFQTVGPLANILQKQKLSGVFAAVGITLISLGLCLLVEILLARWMPFMFGDFRFFRKSEEK